MALENRLGVSKLQHQWGDSQLIITTSSYGNGVLVDIRAHGAPVPRMDVDVRFNGSPVLMADHVGGMRLTIQSFLALVTPENMLAMTEGWGNLEPVIDQLAACLFALQSRVRE